MDVEQEGAIGEGPAALPTGGSDMTVPTDSTVWNTVIVAGMTLVTTLLGLAYKNRKSSQGLEDAVNETTTVTVRSQAARIAELEGQVRDMLAEVSKASSAQVASDGSAQRAQVAAALASEAAERASQEAQESKRLLDQQLRYVRVLRATLIANNIEIPPEPVVT